MPPENVMDFLRKIAPSSSSIQKEYVEKRQRELYKNDPARTKRVKEALEKLLQHYRLGARDWHEVYLLMRSIMDADPMAPAPITVGVTWS
jgi:hypothetical protein